MPILSAVPDNPAALDEPMGLDHRWLILIPLSYFALILVAAKFGKRLSWAMSAGTLGVALLVIADASSFWSANNPSWMTERTFATKGGKDQRNTAEDISIGGGKALAESAIVGIGASIVTGSFWPWAVQALYFGANWPFHHWAMLNPHDNDHSIASQPG